VVHFEILDGIEPRGITRGIVRFGFLAATRLSSKADKLKMNKKGCEGNRDSNPNPPWAHTLDFAVILANVNWCRCSFKTLFAENTLRSGEKNTRWVSFIYPWVMRIFKQQSQWIVGYTQGTVDR